MFYCWIRHIGSLETVREETAKVGPSVYHDDITQLPLSFENMINVSYNDFKCSLLTVSILE